MQKQRENQFREKFRLLNSQEHNEDVKIKWESSSSSDYETSYTEKFVNLEKKTNLKRKRKRKMPKNISNLDVTIIDSCKDRKSDVDKNKSPILVSKIQTPSSPILMSNRFAPIKDSSNFSNDKSKSKSPILHLKYASPNNLGKVKKKLYSEERKHLEQTNTENVQEINEDFIKLEPISISTSDISDSSKKSALIDKIKNYFDSHFSSENTSQNISDTPTPTDSSKIEDIDILSCKSQSVPKIQTNKSEITLDTTSFSKNPKKVKYKKGGLAYRLNVLLKKQNAQLSLWQHERFLAGNSNFIMPKEENVVFRVQKVEFKYGCYLIQAVDVNEMQYFILIHCNYVKTTIVVDGVLKLFDPFKIVNLSNDLKLIINVCKFECDVINK